MCVCGVCVWCVCVCVCACACACVCVCVCVLGRVGSCKNMIAMIALINIALACPVAYYEGV